MINRTRAGMMFIEDGTLTPESLVIDTERYSAGWSSIKCTGAELGKQIEKAGWTFFYMAGEIHTSGFGFNDQSRTDRAVAHVIDAVQREGCNCVEITQMRQRSFLGLRYTSLVAHARHIQRGRIQYPSKMPASTRSYPREWLYDQPPPVGSNPLFAQAVQTWENEGGSRA